MTPQRPHVVEEIHRQPDSWARAVDLAGGLGGVLPRPGERVAVVGCGTSWFVATAYAALREASGAGETDAFAASGFPDGRRYDRVRGDLAVRDDDGDPPHHRARPPHRWSR